MQETKPFENGITNSPPFVIWTNPNLSKRFTCIDCSHAFETKENDVLCSVCKVKRIRKANDPA